MSEDNNGVRPPIPPARSADDIYPFFRRKDLLIPDSLLKPSDGRMTTALEFFSDVHSGRGQTGKFIELGLEPFLASKEAVSHDEWPWIHVHDVSERLTADGRVILYLNAGEIVHVHQDTLIFWR